MWDPQVSNRHQQAARGLPRAQGWKEKRFLVKRSAGEGCVDQSTVATVTAHAPRRHAVCLEYIQYLSGKCFEM